MTFKTLIKSIINLRNLGIAAAGLILFVIFRWEQLLILDFLLYSALVVQLLCNRDFRQRCTIQERIKSIRSLNRKSTSYYFHIKARVTQRFTDKIIAKISAIFGKSGLDDFESRVNKVYAFKAEIVNVFFQKEYSPIRDKVAMKALELSIQYFKLVGVYISRAADVSSNNIKAIEQRISQNKRKKIMSGDSAYAGDIESAIEADERLLERLNESKKEVGKIAAKLDTMESNMLLLKQQIYMELQSEDLFENIDTAINEAQALGSALDQHSQNRRKNRI